VWRAARLYTSTNILARRFDQLAPRDAAAALGPATLEIVKLTSISVANTFLLTPEITISRAVCCFPVLEI
jgi:hypothetical protein